MSALDLMRARLMFRGGDAQQDRMIRDKRKTLDRAVLYSYQGARIKKVNSEEIAPALVNPNKLKQDYDDKVVSVGFEYGFKPGDVFDWMNTGTKWLIYLQDLTELAYFRGDIRRCRYKIDWLDEDEVKTTYAAIRGPIETKINYIQKGGISVDVPNHSLDMLIPRNEDTLKFFKRYAEFYLQDPDITTCWRVEAVNTVSTPGIIEVVAIEYYGNEFEDGDGIVGALVGKPIEPEPQSPEIVGDTFIKPKIVYTFTYEGEKTASWEWDKTLPLSVTVDDKTISLSWTKTYSGQFVLRYGESEKTIVVESLF